MAREALEAKVAAEFRDLRERIETNEDHKKRLEEAQAARRERRVFVLRNAVWLVILELAGILGVRYGLPLGGRAVQFTNKLSHTGWTLLVAAALFTAWLRIAVKRGERSQWVKSWHVFGRLRGLQNWIYGVVITGAVVNGVYELIKFLGAPR